MDLVMKKNKGQWKSGKMELSKSCWTKETT